MIRPRLVGPRAAVALALATLVVAGACGSSSSSKAGKSVVIGSAPFPESEIVADMYAGILRADGYQVTVRPGLGQREIYFPALQSGGKNNGIDLVPEYVGTLLEYVNKNAGEASGDLGATLAKLQARLQPLGLTALDASPAADQNAFAVSKATADKYKLKKLSDLTPIASTLTLGAGPECAARPFCAPGLERVYGIKFKTVRVFDTSGGASTLDALAHGDIDVGLVFSSDGGVAANNLVVLDDDKKLQTVDNIVPAIRNDVLDDTIRKDLNKVSAALNTPDLIVLNKRAGVDKADPEALATEWLQQHGFVKKK